MKKLAKISLLLLVFGMMQVTSVMAQKYGHVNSGNIIAQLPETKAADSQLIAYRDQLVKKGEEMATAVQTEYQAFATEYQGGGVTPVEAQKKEAYFQAKQQELAQYEQKVMQDMEKRRTELYQPILERVQTVLDEIGKEGGYSMIFDTSILAGNPILFAEDSVDLNAQVIAKMK